MSLNTSLAGYWKFDETSGNAEDSFGTSDLTNNATTPYVAAKLNNGADLELGSSQYFNVADNATLSITGDMTISGWIKLESGTLGTFVAKRDSTSNQRSFSFSLGTDSMVFGATSSGGAVTDVSVAPTLTAGTWYMATVVYTASAGSAKFYLNGSQVGTTQTGLPTSIFNSTSDFSIGCIFAPAQDFFDGIVDEVGIWARVLTSDELTTLYNAGTPLTYPFTTQYTMNCDVGAFTLTHQTSIVGRLYTLVCDVGSYILTFPNFISRLNTWVNQSKNTSSYSNQSKNSSNWTNESKS